MYSSLNLSRLSRLLVSCVGKKIISHTAAVLALGIMTFSSFAQTSTSIDVVTQSRQILQMAEYIGVDYSEAVVDGEIASEDEFAEMQQFAKLILQKGEVIERESIDGANHFFTGKHDELIDICEAYVDRRLIDDEEKLRREAEAATAKAGSRKPPIPRALPLKPEDNGPVE